MLPSLEPRLSVLDFVSQLWRKTGKSCETKSGTESLGSRLRVSKLRRYLVRMHTQLHKTQQMVSALDQEKLMQ